MLILKVRLVLKLSLLEVAEKTRMTQEQIVHIEQDELEAPAALINYYAAKLNIRNDYLNVLLHNPHKKIEKIRYLFAYILESYFDLILYIRKKNER